MHTETRPPEGGEQAPHLPEPQPLLTPTGRGVAAKKPRAKRGAPAGRGKTAARRKPGVKMPPDEKKARTKARAKKRAPGAKGRFRSAVETAEGSWQESRTGGRKPKAAQRKSRDQRPAKKVRGAGGPQTSRRVAAKRHQTATRAVAKSTQRSKLPRR